MCCPGWPRTKNPPTSASWVAEIIGCSPAFDLPISFLCQHYCGRVFLEDFETWFLKHSNWLSLYLSMPDTNSSIYINWKKIVCFIPLPIPFLINLALQGGGLMEVRVRIPSKGRWKASSHENSLYPTELHISLQVLTRESLGPPKATFTCHCVEGAILFSRSTELASFLR
jgi:hypothetical protein